MESLAREYEGTVNFLLINCQSISDAESYAAANNLSMCPHGSGPVPGEYGVRYIPHKTLIGKDGLIMKNYEGFNWTDIDVALAADAGGGGGRSDGVSADASDVAKVFAKCDLNGDGLIDKRELHHVLSSIDPKMWTKKAIKSLFGKADTDEDGRLDYAEFAAWLFGDDAGRLRRSLGIASCGGDGGLPQCRNMCGRTPFKHHPTCCTYCRGGSGPHAEDCDARSGTKCTQGCGRNAFASHSTCCKSCSGRAGPHSSKCDERGGPQCTNGCGRKPYRDYPTCCTHCTSASGPHARSCREAGGSRPGTAPAPRGLRGGGEIGLSKILGAKLLSGDGSTVETNDVLGAAKLVGILFTAMW
eukprot:TRINITY_DN31207_c0_g1_i1.p1 TRINITY_DN31207_c0_g1~~TRINITY_DN31207_c0_g1_i1.p1  ORF type:complete len:357 (+),score=47.79 TRINITY_DN31207_c0_g1_i1:290-1360(+)